MVHQGLLGAGSPSGIKSWPSVSVPIALLRPPSRRSGSILLVFKVTTFGYRWRKICRERAISLMSRLTSICTIYGLLSTTFGLGVRHTGPIGRLKPSAGRTVGITGKSLWAVCKVLSVTGLQYYKTSNGGWATPGAEHELSKATSFSDECGVHDRTQFCLGTHQVD